MTSCRRTARILALAAVVLAGVLVPGVVASAQQASGPVEVSVSQVGWWTSRPGATSTEDAGFEVATDGAGEPQSVAAVQTIIDAATVDSFAISLSESSALAEFSSIAVCRIEVGWVAENPGSLEDAPPPECSTKVHLTRSADAMTWLGDLTPLVRDGGTVSLAFLPEYRPPTTLGTGMVVRIAEIVVEATGTADAPAGATSPTTQAAPAPPATEAPAASPTTVASSPPPGTSSGPFDVPPPSSVTTTSSTIAVTDVDPTAGEADGAEEEEFFTLGPVQHQTAESKPWARLVLLVPLSALVGAGAVRVRRLASS